MNGTGSYDVAVVGAGVAGCAVARLFARRGARVALVERRHDPAAYKVTCTHAILPSAVPTIDRLGLAPLLLARGAVRTGAEIWTPYGGWIGLPEEATLGWGVTRQTLDPLLRELAAGTPGVDFFPGWKAAEVLADHGRPCGVRVEDRGHRTMRVSARLLVAADGRESPMARLAGVPGRVRPHNRFFYFAYWRGVQPARTSNRLWFLDPEGAAEFPNEDGLTLLVSAYHRSHLAEVRADVEGSYLRRFAGLPDGPQLSDAERVSKVLGKLDMPNVIRPAARPGIAFVGDAALATDPLFGVGISFAFQSAQWLVEETSGALSGAEELDRALRSYRSKFAWRLAPHHLQIADFSTGRRFRPLERLAFRRAATDPPLARALGEVLTRERSPLHVLDPRTAVRVLVPRRPHGRALAAPSRGPLPASP